MRPDDDDYERKPAHGWGTPPKKYEPPNLEIQYPGWVTYALVGKSEAAVYKAIGDVVGKFKHKLKKVPDQNSSGGFSIHVETWVTSDYQRTDFFHRFQIHPAIRQVF
jgi:hypothetical protein